MQQRLQRAEYTDEVVQSTLHWLLEHGLQSDDRFAESFVRTRVAQGYGPLRIRAELRQRGVTHSLIETHLDGRDWSALAVRAHAKRFGQSPCDSLKDKAKRYRFLNTRGFNHEQTRYALNKADSDV